MNFTFVFFAVVLSTANAYILNRPHYLKPLSSPPSTSLKQSLVTHYEEMSVPTKRGLSLIDITKEVSEIIKKTSVTEGVVTVLSRHSTVSVFINEMEPRLVDDYRQFLLKLCPPEYPWLHNDLDERSGPPNWPGGDEAWRNFRAGEPYNAHSHIIAMLAGTSESIPIHKGEMKIGTYQNIIVLDADGTNGTKRRSIAVQITGTRP